MSKPSTTTTTTAAAAAPPKPKSKPKPNSQDIPSAGTILVALTASLVCWLLTGIIGHTAPRAHPADDATVLTMILWSIQLCAGIFLVVAAADASSSSSPSSSSSSSSPCSPAAALSAALLGAGVAGAWGAWVAEWGNAATWAFWVFAGVYVALGVEAWGGGCAGVERWIAVRLEGAR